jgi:hypothetical protein
MSNVCQRLNDRSAGAAHWKPLGAVNRNSLTPQFFEKHLSIDPAVTIHLAAGVSRPETLKINAAAGPSKAVVIRHGPHLRKFLKFSQTSHPAESVI